MTACKRILVLALIALTAPAFGAANKGITLSHFERLEAFEMDAGGGAGQQEPGGIGPLELRFHALGRQFELELQPNAKVLAAMRDSGQSAGGAVAYRGRIKGVDGSWARIVIANGMPSGLVSDGTGVIALESPGDALVETTGPIAYRLADAVISPGALSCATGSLPTSAEAALATVTSGVDPVALEAAGAASELTIGMIADFEATSAFGASIDSAIMTRLNNVDGIYSEQIGVQIRVPLIESFPGVDDPFSDTTDSSELLRQLASYRGSNGDQNSLGLTHLYTGRNLQGTTVGIAYLDVLCNSRAGAGLSEISNSPTIDSLVAAHEIGHNFGAEHDGAAGTPCADEPLTYIMAPRVSASNNTFSACSASVMQANAARASCITALPGTDMSVEFRDAAATVLLGGSDSTIVDVVNNGTEAAQNVVVDISVPDNVTLVSAASAAGTCEAGAGSVRCAFGSVAGGTAAEIDLRISGASIGSGTFSASVTADADDQAGNNQDSLQLTVDPAVDLAINALPSSQVTLDGSTSLTMTFENRAALDATGVTLSIALNAGLRANSASWSVGSCNVAAQQVDCQAARFDRQSSGSLTLNVTGVAEGTKNYTVTLASAEADTNSSDNSAQGSVRVRTASGGGTAADEGGGSMGWLLLAMLAALSTRRALRPSCRAD